MTQNSATIQGFLSVAAMICLAVGWFNLFSPEINHILYNIVFYILIGLSFFFAAQFYPNKNHKYIGYAAALFCIVGPFLPENLSVVKTIGLFAGVILSFFARPRQIQR